MLHGIGINLGQSAEELFYYALKNKKQLGTIKFDSIGTNVERSSGKVTDEFDIVMYTQPSRPCGVPSDNGDSIALIEVKHKVHPSDIEKLKTKKVQDFKLLFPQYANHKIYLGIGGNSIPAVVAETALNEGIAVLRHHGEIAEIEATKMKAY